MERAGRGAGQRARPDRRVCERLFMVNRRRSGRLRARMWLRLRRLGLAKSRLRLLG